MAINTRLPSGFTGYGSVIKYNITQAQPIDYAIRYTFKLMVTQIYIIDIFSNMAMITPVDSDEQRKRRG